MSPLEQKLHDTDVACARVRVEAEKLLMIFKDDVADAESSALIARDLTQTTRHLQALTIILAQHLLNIRKIQEKLLPVITRTGQLFPLTEMGVAAAIRKTEEESR